MSEEQLKTIRESITVNFKKLNYKIEKKLTNRNISIIFQSHFNNITQNSNFSPSRLLQKNNKKDACYRCGRDNHYANNCYASTNINGHELESDSDSDY